MIDYKLEYLFSYIGKLASSSYSGTLPSNPEMIGPLAEGLRVNFYSTGGVITGSKLRGKLRPVGGDWVTVRRDGVALLDVRTTFETHDGALILVTYQGIVDFGEDGYDRFLQGDIPPVVPIRMSPRFSTSHADYLWLNRLQCLGIGEYYPSESEAKYDVYAVR